MRLALILSFVFLMGIASASSVVCTIVDDKVFVEADLDEGVDVMLPEEYSLLEQKGDKVSFISKEFLKKDGEWIFVLPNILTESYDLEVYLPENYVLKDDLVYPKGYEISSDGRSIILRWDNVGDEVIVFYEGVENAYVWFWVVILVLVIGAFGFLRFQRKRFFLELERLKKEVRAKSNASKDVLITKNLFGEEKRIVEFLIKKKTCWMKELVRELEISKVMATRKVRNLIEKGIVVRESFGRENRLRLAR